jgi:hypothetical protein
MLNYVIELHCRLILRSFVQSIQFMHSNHLPCLRPPLDMPTVVTFDLAAQPPSVEQLAQNHTLQHG